MRNTDWKFGDTKFTNNKYYYKPGILKLDIHGWTKTGLKGKPVSGGYSIEIESKVADPKELKYYFKDTSKSYPNYITSKSGSIKHFDTKTDVKKHMTKWVKDNKNNINRFTLDYKK